MDEGPDAGELHERVLREMVAALPEEERPTALARLLEQLERIHREHHAEAPPWLRALRERLGGGEAPD